MRDPDSADVEAGVPVGQTEREPGADSALVQGADWGAIKAGLMVPGAIAFAPDAKPRFPTREA